MFGLGTWELLIILVGIMLLFGAKRLPAMGRGLGEGLRGFRDAVKGGGDESSADDDPKQISDTKKSDA